MTTLDNKWKMFRFWNFSRSYGLSVWCKKRVWKKSPLTAQPWLQVFLNIYMLLCDSPLDGKFNDNINSLLLSLWCFSIFVKYYFLVSFNSKIILSMIKITQYRDCAPLNIISGGEVFFMMDFTGGDSVRWGIFFPRLEMRMMLELCNTIKHKLSLIRFLTPWVT